jgi:hypothetical protein
VGENYRGGVKEVPWFDMVDLYIFSVAILGGWVILGDGGGGVGYTVGVLVCSDLEASVLWYIAEEHMAHIFGVDGMAEIAVDISYNLKNI